MVYRGLWPAVGGTPPIHHESRLACLVFVGFWGFWWAKQASQRPPPFSLSTCSCSWLCCALCVLVSNSCRTLFASASVLLSQVGGVHILCVCLYRTLPTGRQSSGKISILVTYLPTYLSLVLRTYPRCRSSEYRQHRFRSIIIVGSAPDRDPLESV